MVQQLVNNSQGCATEVEEGTAYQSWDWRNGAKTGVEFQSVALDSSQSWQTIDEGGEEPSKVIPAWTGPWNKSVLGGDSRWHQAAWDCRTRMDTLGEYGSILLEELNWFKAIFAPWEKAELSFQEFWQFKIKWPFDEGWLKVEESWNTKANLPFDEWTWVHEQDYLKLWPSYEENGIWSEAWKLILIWYFDEGFFGLHEVQWMRFSFVQEEEWKIQEHDWLKLYPEYLDQPVWGEFWNLKLFYDFNEGYVDWAEAIKVNAWLPWEETWKVSDADWLKLYPFHADSVVLSEFWTLTLIWHFNEGFFDFQEGWMLRFDWVTSENLVLQDLDYLKLWPEYSDTAPLSEFWNLKMFYNFNEGWIALEELLSLHFAFETADSFFISESNRFQVQQALVDRLVLSELLNFKIGYNFDEGWFKFQESWMMEGILGRNEALELEELWSLNAEISILDSGLVSEVLALMFSFQASDSILLEENYYLSADWFKTENDKLSESFSIVLKSNGYGVNGYGVVGYGV